MALSAECGLTMIGCREGRCRYVRHLPRALASRCQPLVTDDRRQLRCGRYDGMMPGGGVFGVGDGDGEFPSLADTIAAVRRELSAAQAAGQGQPVQFRTGPVELEFEVAVTRTGGGQAGVQIWVLTLGGKVERGMRPRSGSR